MKTERKCAHNTTVKYIKNFKKIVLLALSKGWIRTDPFVNIRYHLDEVDMHYLTQDELEILRQTEIPMARLQVIKDIYTFCCFTGLAFIDIKRLNYEDLTIQNGKIWLKIKRQKTKNWCHVPLLEPAVRIIEKFRTHPVCQKTGMVLPVPSNQKMNAYLKEIAVICKINKNLCTHTARHTFATTVTLSNQVSIEVVSKMLGHSSIEMTQRYARVLDTRINKDMDKVFGLYE